MFFFNKNIFEDALACYQEDLAVCRHIGDRPGESTTLDNLGLVYSKIHREQDALECYEQGLQISRELGDRHNQAYLLLKNRSIQLSIGQITEAKNLLRTKFLVCPRLGGSSRRKHKLDESRNDL